MAMVRFLNPSHPEFRRRMDADYWDPQYTELQKALLAMPGVQRLGDFLPAGRIVTAHKGIVRYQPEGIPLLTARNLVPTGIDWGSEMRCVQPNGPADPPRSRLIEGDVLLVRSGVGCAGECAVARLDGRAVNVRSELYILRPVGLDPYVLLALLKSQAVRMQMQRLLCGVGTINLSQPEIRSLLIPVPGEAMQAEIRERMEDAARCHEQAMALKPRAKVASIWTNRFNELRYTEKLHEAEERLAGAVALLERRV